MLNKKLFVLVVALIFASVSAVGFTAEVNESGTVDRVLQGGEANTLTGSFEHDGNFDDVQVKLSIYSSTGIEGGEFYNFSGSINDETLGCSDRIRLNSSSVVRECEAEDIDQEQVDFNLSFDTALAIEPGSYTMQVEVGPSLIPVDDESTVENSTTVSESGQARVKAGSSSVSINATADSSVSVRSFNPDDDTRIPRPSDQSESVGAVTVTASQDNSGGSVSFEHDKDPEDVDMSVYYWDQSQAEWIDDNVVDGSVEVNSTHVTADVSHFSTYAAYSEPVEDEEDDDSGSSGGGGGGLSAAAFNEEPVSVGAGEDRTVEVGESVLFNASVLEGSAEDIEFEWSFGDGESSTGKSVTRSYTSSGQYTAVLNASNGENQDSDNLTLTVEEPVTEENQSQEDESTGETDQGSDEGTDPDTTGESDQQSQQQSLTGQFTDSPGNIVATIAGLLVLIAIYLQRTGRIDAVTWVKNLRN